MGLPLLNLKYLTEGLVEGFDIGGDIVACKDGTARDQKLGTSLGGFADGGGVDAAIYLNFSGGAGEMHHMAHAADFVGAGGNISLTAKAGVDAHHQNLVNIGQNFFKGGCRGGGIKSDTSLYACFFNHLDGAVQVGAGFDMDGDEVGTGLGKGGNVFFWFDNHQVGVEKEAKFIGEGAEGLEDGDADGDVGDKAAIHHVYMNVGESGLGDGADLCAELGEIAGEDGGLELVGGGGHGGLAEKIVIKIVKRKSAEQYNDKDSNDEEQDFADEQFSLLLFMWLAIAGSNQRWFFHIGFWFGISG
jgi:hypothetical protein